MQQTEGTAYVLDVYSFCFPLRRWTGPATSETDRGGPQMDRPWLHIISYLVNGAVGDRIEKEERIQLCIDQRPTPGVMLRGMLHEEAESSEVGLQSHFLPTVS